MKAKRYAELVCNGLEVRIKSLTITKLKTPQAIGAIHELLEEKEIKKAMVVVPASLKYQWEEEVGKFSNHDCIVIDGTPAKRKKQYNTWVMSAIPIAIIGYETLRGDIDIIKELDIDCISLDEAHKIKNRATKMYKALIQLKPEYRFALTGTPMQNKPEEIYALMSWLEPEVLGKVTAFRKRHIVTGEKFGRRFIDLGYKHLDEIREKISPRLLRRMKTEVAPDLPEMVFVTSRSEMTKPQRELYETIEEDFKLLQKEIQEFHETLSDAESRKGTKHEKEDAVLGYMYMMQAVSDHPLLLSQGDSGMAKKYLPLVRKCTTSPKLEELMELLSTALERGSKVVIFSQYARMLLFLEQRVKQQFEQDPYMIYGAIPSKQRQEQLVDFRTNPNRNIMLLSDAGNYGLNLQFSDTLINYDLSWNPAVMA